MGEKELCKVADFGQVVQLPRDGKDGDKSCVVEASDINKLQFRWCAPEYLKEGKCSIASDVWSFGVLMWEMAHPGSRPYDNFSNDEVAGKICAGYSLTIPSDYPKAAQDITKACWRPDPKKRPSFAAICISLTKVKLN